MLDQAHLIAERSRSPTAQMSSVEMPEMLRSLPNWPGCGTGTAVHRVPFQCSTSGRDPIELTSEDSPTAHTSFGPKAATPVSTLFTGFPAPKFGCGFGLRTMDH